MQPTDEKIYLADVNRELIKQLLNSAPDLQKLMPRVKPVLGESLAHPGQTALVLLCETEAIASTFIRQLTVLRQLLLNVVPFAELRIETI
jgi:hypothetical protein